MARHREDKIVPRPMLRPPAHLFLQGLHNFAVGNPFIGFGVRGFVIQTTTSPFVILSIAKDLFSSTLCFQILRLFVPQNDTCSFEQPLT